MKMKYSLQVSFLLCLINLYDLQSFGTEATPYDLNSQAEYDADSTNSYVIKLPGTCGYNTEEQSSDRSSSDSKHGNEILIENTKHFHEHNHNYLLIGLGSSEEQSTSLETPDSYEHVRKHEEVVKITVPKVQPVEYNDEEEYYDEENDAAIGHGTYVDYPQSPKVEVVEEDYRDVPSTCESRVYASLTADKLKGGRRRDLKRSKNRNVGDRKPALEDKHELDDLVDDVPNDDYKTLLQGNYDELV